MTTSNELVEAITATGVGFTWKYVNPVHVDDDTRLHWKVALTFNGRAFMEIDYWAGQGHCPAYSRPLSGYSNSSQSSEKQTRRALIRAELETGLEHVWNGFNPRLRMVEDTENRTSDGRVWRKRVPIAPQLPSVIASVILDTQAGELTFQDFCSELGYDADSRKHYATWLACVETAAQWRRLPQSVRDTLGELLADY